MLSITVILSCSSLGFPKPLFLDMSLPLDQILNQQAPGQETKPQGNAFQSEESINQWDDVTIGMNLETQPEDDAFQTEEEINQENEVTSGMDQETQPKGDAFQPEDSLNQENDVRSGMDQVNQPQGDAFQPEKSINQENDVTSGMDQDTQPQGDAFQPTQSINQENNVTSGMDAYLDKPSAHNRTARDVSSPCFSHIVRKFDKCRKKFVSHVQCLNRHITCYEAINIYHYPKCETVIGYRQIKFINKCPPLPVACQCAA